METVILTCTPQVARQIREYYKLLVEIAQINQELCDRFPRQREVNTVLHGKLIDRLRQIKSRLEELKSELALHGQAIFDTPSRRHMEECLSQLEDLGCSTDKEKVCD